MISSARLAATAAQTERWYAASCTPRKRGLELYRGRTEESTRDKQRAGVVGAAVAAERRQRTVRALDERVERGDARCGVRRVRAVLRADVHRAVVERGGLGVHRERGKLLAAVVDAATDVVRHRVVRVSLYDHTL